MTGNASKPHAEILDFSSTEWFTDYFTDLHLLYGSTVQCVTCNLDVHMAIQQQILSLQVSVNDVPVVAVLNRWQDLPELPPGL